MSQNFRTDEESNTQRRAGILGLNYTDTSKTTDKQLYLGLLPIQQMYDFRVVPLVSDAHNILFGVTNNTSQQTLANLRQKFLDQKIDFSLISDTGFRDYMKLYDPPKQVEYHDIKLGGQSEQSLSNVSTTLEQVNADDTLAFLVEQAHKLNASDIHIETLPDKARIRFRIDGVLHSIAELSQEKYRVLIAAVASSGNISTSADEAQQGHIAQHLKMATGEQVDVNVRLETTPTINGMDVVMRLFNMDKSMFTLDRLGLSDKERSVLNDIIEKPSGLVLVVGPTGSGKTTTLYSILNSLASDELKIVTVEDPVEYQFPGITQIPVNSKTSGETQFAEKLRAVLRLDPDVVMVGEIRDMDTAKTALQASLTGHLVLATFHAGSASAALTRLVDVIGQNPLFISSIRLIMAQRLVRRLDDKTKVAYSPDEKTLTTLTQIIEHLPEGVAKPNLSGLQLYKPGKTPENPYGFSGQIAIREQFLITPDVQKLLIENKSLTTAQIEQTARSSGMVTLLEDGLLKVIAGLTTIDEISREVG